ncbi:MAG TPA: capsule assembly Wzi family protein, partial [Bacteroidota bacterium]|nr:capsule assembly Wzi family protein [Bacteroidota bacterium]
LTSQPGYAKSIAYNKNGYDYDDAEVQIGFRFGEVQLFFEKIRNTWGYGRSGSLVLSERAPGYPQVRFSVQLLSNLKLTMLVAYLYSGLVDSTRTYTDYTDGTFKNPRVVYRDKYLFAHALEYSPTTALNLTLGEEVLISDRFDPGYLLPIAFYHTVEVQAGAIDNINVWGGARYTFRGIGSLYTTLYLDNFDVTEGFYIVAGTLGGTAVNVGNSGIDLTAEYTLLRPFVYSNNITALNRTSNGYPIGYWLGEDGDVLQGWVDYRPIPRLCLTASYQKVRKGPIGTTAQHYAGGQFGFAKLDFLGGPTFRRSEFDFACKWEVWRGLFADLSYRLLTQSDPLPNREPDLSNRSLISFALQLNIFQLNDQY